MPQELILQSPMLNPLTVEKIAALANANGVQALGQHVVRLMQVEVDDAARTAVEHACAHAKIDMAFLDRIDAWADAKVLVSDMDSTLINIECIDEIAALAGRGQAVAAMTAAAMRGEMPDFAHSLRQRVALLQGVPLAVLEQVYHERLRLNPGAEELLAAAQRIGMQTLLVSGGFTFFTERLRARLGLTHTRANTLEIVDGKLTGRVLGEIIDGEAKARAVRDLMQKTHASPRQTLVLGDGANDLPMMALAHYCVAWRAKPVVRAQARYRLDVCGLDGVLNWFRH